MNKPQILPSGNARIRITGPDGARHSVTEATPRKAERAAKALLGKLHAEHQAKLDAKVAATEARKNPRRRFDLYAESYLHTRRPGEPYGYSQVVYRQRLNHLRTLNETFGHMFVQDITPQDVRDWWTSRSATPSHRSSLYAFLRLVFGQAMDDELIQRSPCRVKGAGRPSSRKRPTSRTRTWRKFWEQRPSLRCASCCRSSWAPRCALVSWWLSTGSTSNLSGGSCTSAVRGLRRRDGMPAR